MYVFLSADITEDSIVDGAGLRSVLWFQGCSHNCKGCHNPETHSFNVGKKMLVTDVIKLIDDLDNQDGITFSGGDPFFQPEAFLELLMYAKSKDINCWAFTGFTYGQLLKMDKIYLDILSNLDVLVDGKFIQDKKSLNVKYRGSSNQCVIDVKESLKNSKEVRLYE